MRRFATPGSMLYNVMIFKGYSRKTFFRSRLNSLVKMVTSHRWSDMTLFKS